MYINIEKLKGHKIGLGIFNRRYLINLCAMSTFTMNDRTNLFSEI